MVHTGWALALPVRGTVYAAVQEQAQKARRGLWRGDFIRPWKWREGRRLSC
jgi:endonuclease YncB( thermonuclease family)